VAEGGFYFITAETTREGGNLAADSRCAIASSSTAPPAVDVIVDGEAVKVTGDAKVRWVADAFASTMQWPLEAVTARWWARMLRPRGRLRMQCSS
jgi:hypothetical protein